MVGHAPLWEIVGANALGAITRSDESFALCCPRHVGALTFQLEQTRLQQLYGLRLVLVLRFLGLLGNRDTRRNVGNAHGALCFVDVLPARSGSTKDINSQILVIDVDFDVFGFGKNSDRRSRSVNSAPGLRDGNALHTMPA